MTFLKKLGTILLKSTEVITGVAGYMPLIQSAVQTFAPGAAGQVARVTTDIEQIAGVVVQVEAVGQALQIAGPQKLQAAAPLVAQVIMQSALLAHHKIGDEQLFKEGCAAMADGMAKILNSIKDSVETESKAA